MPTSDIQHDAINRAILDVLTSLDAIEARTQALESALLAAKETIRALADLALEQRSEIAQHCQRWIRLDAKIAAIEADRTAQEGDHK
jgi:uncharacterized coiled-coil protein SlyX